MGKAADKPTAPISASTIKNAVEVTADVDGVEKTFTPYGMSAFPVSGRSILVKRHHFKGS